MVQKIVCVVLLLFSTISVSQENKYEVIKLWEHEGIPFNKENITVKEILGKEGKRYSQISEPMLYVYKNKEIKNNGSVLLVCPGGGYSKVTIGRNNGEGTAKYYHKMGFNVVAVLKYRLPDTLIVNHQEKVPLCDAQKALAIVHRNASKWSVSNHKVAVLGSSAGGHLVASLANLKTEIIAPNVTKDELKIAVSILLYPVVSFNLPYRHKGSYKKLLADKAGNQKLLDFYSMENQVSDLTPPTFIIHATDDKSVSYKNSLMYCESLKAHGVNYKYVQLDKGGHGFGTNFKKTGVDWTIQLKEWLDRETNIFDD